MRILGGNVKFINLLSVLVLAACSGRGIEPTEIYYLGQANLDKIPSSTQEITDEQFKGAVFLAEEHQAESVPVTSKNVKTGDKCEFIESYEEVNEKVNKKLKELSGESCEFTYKESLTTTNAMFDEVNPEIQTKTETRSSGALEFHLESEKNIKDYEGMIGIDYSQVKRDLKWTRKGRNNEKQYAFGLTYLSKVSFKNKLDQEISVEYGKFTKINEDLEQGTLKLAIVNSFAIHNEDPVKKDQPSEKPTPDTETQQDPVLKNQSKVANEQSTDEEEPKILEGSSETPQTEKVDPTKVSYKVQINGKDQYIQSIPGTTITIKVSFKKLPTSEEPVFDAAMINGRSLSPEEMEKHRKLFLEYFNRADYQN